MKTKSVDGHAQVLEMASAFAATLKATPVFEHFSDAERLFQTDPALQAMIKTLRQKSEEFQKAERAGTLRREQTQEFQEMRNNFQSHPLLRNFQDARESAELLLKETNSIISQMLGVDFGQTAAPAGGGCC